MTRNGRTTGHHVRGAAQETAGAPLRKGTSALAPQHPAEAVTTATQRKDPRGASAGPYRRLSERPRSRNADGRERPKSSWVPTKPKPEPEINLIATEGTGRACWLSPLPMEGPGSRGDGGMSVMLAAQRELDEAERRRERARRARRLEYRRSLTRQAISLDKEHSKGLFSPPSGPADERSLSQPEFTAEPEEEYDHKSPRTKAELRRHIGVALGISGTGMQETGPGFVITQSESESTTIGGDPSRRSLGTTEASLQDPSLSLRSVGYLSIAESPEGTRPMTADSAGAMASRERPKAGRMAFHSAGEMEFYESSRSSSEAASSPPAPPAYSPARSSASGSASRPGATCRSGMASSRPTAARGLRTGFGHGLAERPSSAPVLGLERKALGINGKFNPRARLCSIAERMEDHQALLQGIRRLPAPNPWDEPVALQTLPQEIKQIKADLAKLQKEVIGASNPDQLCNSLGSALVRMPGKRRGNFFEFTAAFGFSNLLDFLYQACTTAECLVQDRHLRRQSHVHQRNVSARKTPQISERKPYFGPAQLRDRPPDLFSQGMAMP